MANRFLSAKKSLVGTGELSPSTWRSYFMACELVVEHFGKDRLATDFLPGDFEKFKNELAKTRGPVALGSVIQRIRTLFKFAWDEGVIEKPIRFGSVFRKPSKKRCGTLAMPPGQGCSKPRNSGSCSRPPVRR